MKGLVGLLAAVILCSSLTTESSAQAQRNIPINTRPQQDPIVLGAPLSHWIEVIRNRNTEELGVAYTAITALGPDASSAVPDLARIVDEPFSPIQLGKDDRREVLSKLKNIFIRGGAVDSLGAIGAAAAPSAHAVIEWSLTIRVLSQDASLADPLFIDLVTMDVLERMRGAGAVAQFGIGAADRVQELIESGDSERRKFAVAILNEESLPIASNLMRSNNCRERELGLAVLADMWPVVPAIHLDTLTAELSCTEREPEGKSLFGKATRLGFKGETREFR